MCQKRWAEANSALSHLYGLRGSADDIEKALQPGKAATQSGSAALGKTAYAKSEANLGKLFFERTKGDRGENLEAALKHWLAASEHSSVGRDPGFWARVQVSLSKVLLVRKTGDVVGNREQGLRRAEDVLEFRSVPTNERASAEEQICAAYLQRLTGDRSENFEQAIPFCEASAAAIVRSESPATWANAQLRLAEAYSLRRGAPAQYADNAWVGLNALFEHLTPKEFSREWSKAHLMAGRLQLTLWTGDREKSLRAAIGHLSAAARELEQARDHDTLALARALLAGAIIESDKASPTERLEALVLTERTIEYYDRQGNRVGQIASAQK